MSRTATRDRQQMPKPVPPPPAEAFIPGSVAEAAVLSDLAASQNYVRRQEEDLISRLAKQYHTSPEQMREVEVSAPGLFAQISGNAGEHIRAEARRINMPEAQAHYLALNEPEQWAHAIGTPNHTDAQGNAVLVPYEREDTARLVAESNDPNNVQYGQIYVAYSEKEQWTAMFPPPREFPVDPEAYSRGDDSAGFTFYQEPAIKVPRNPTVLLQKQKQRNEWGYAWSFWPQAPLRPQPDKECNLCRAAGLKQAYRGYSTYDVLMHKGSRHAHLLAVEERFGRNVVPPSQPTQSNVVDFAEALKNPAVRAALKAALADDDAAATGGEEE